MNMNETERKAHAVKLMQQLGLREVIIEQFTKNGNRQCSCSTSDYGTAYNVKPFEKMIELEKEQDITIYAAIFTRFSFGDCVTFLVVPKYEEDWYMLIRPTKQKDIFSVYAYVWNVTEEYRSEFGYVQVQVIDGILQRIS